MTPRDCETFRSFLLERALEPLAGGASASSDRERWAEEHERECEDCRMWLTRQRQVVGLVGQLDRYAAPEALDRGVADAIAADLRRGKVLQSLADERAPGVLERLVAEEIEAGASAVVARSLAGLARRSAPAELEDLVAERLHADLWSEREHAGRGTDRSPRRPSLLVDTEQPRLSLPTGPGGLPAGPWGLRAGALAAAAVVLVLSLPTVLQRDLIGSSEGDGSMARDLPEPRVQLTMVSSASALSPLARDLGAGLAGGAGSGVIR